MSRERKQLKRLADIAARAQGKFGHFEFRTDFATMFALIGQLGLS